jgi:hypothetical protein
VLKIKRAEQVNAREAANSDVEWFAGLREFAAALSQSFGVSCF